jgi:uncharacterized protein (TIRG00374 family)
MNGSFPSIEGEKKNRWSISTLVKVAIAIFILTYLFRHTSAHDLISKIKQIDLFTLCFCIAVLFVLNLSIAIRWQIILRHFGADGFFASLWRFTMIGAFFNQLLPTGMGGDIFRIGYARASGVPLVTAVKSVLIDRIIGFLGLIILIVIGVPYLLSVTQIGTVIITLLILVGLLATAISLFLRIDLLNRALCKFPYFSKWRCSLGFSARLLNSVEQCATDARSLLSNWPNGLIVLFLSLINQTFLGLVVFLLARAMGDHLDLFATVVAFPFVLLLSMIPISLAGWGLREGAMVVVFELLGMPRDTALGVSILFGICLFLSALPGACMWLVGPRYVTAKVGS